jgi:hypothetical protein
MKQQLFTVAMVMWGGIAVADPLVIEPIPGGLSVTCSADDCLGEGALSEEYVTVAAADPLVVEMGESAGAAEDGGEEVRPLAEPEGFLAPTPARLEPIPKRPLALVPTPSGVPCRDDGSDVVPSARRALGADPLHVESIPGGLKVTCDAEDCLAGIPLRDAPTATTASSTSTTAAERLAVRAIYTLRAHLGLGDAEYRAVPIRERTEAVTRSTRFEMYVGGVKAGGNVIIATNCAGTHVRGVYGTFPQVTDAMRAPATLSLEEAVAGAMKELGLNEHTLAYWRRTHPLEQQEPYSGVLVTRADGPMWVVTSRAGQKYVHIDARTGEVNREEVVVPSIGP